MMAGTAGGRLLREHRHRQDPAQGDHNAGRLKSPLAGNAEIPLAGARRLLSRPAAK